MAAALDVQLGTNSGQNVTSVNLSTANAVAAGAFIYIHGGRFNSTNTTLTVSGGSLTWTEILTQVNGTARRSIFRAYAPSGLASGTTITLTGSAAGNDLLISGESWVGLDPSQPTPTARAGIATGTNWDTGSGPIPAGGIALGGVYGNDVAGTNTPTGGASEIQDFTSGAAGEMMATEYKATPASTDSLTGTLSASQAYVSLMVSQTTPFDPPVLPPFLPLQRVPGPKGVLREYRFSEEVLSTDQTAELAMVTETDSAQPFGGILSLATVSEVDTTPAVGTAQSRALTLVTETDTTLAVGRTSVNTLAAVTETDTAQAVGRTLSTGLAAVSETDSALTLGRTSSAALTLVTEVDSVLAFGAAGQSTALATVTETDSVMAFGLTLSQALGVVSETDSAISLGTTQSRALTLVTETDSVIAVGRAKALSTVTEADTVLVFSGTLARAIGLVSESDAAVALGPTQTRAISTVAETDTVLTFGRTNTVVLGIVTEVDTARPIIGGQVATTRQIHRVNYTRFGIY